MAIINGKGENVVKKTETEIKLEKEELEFLLKLIANSTFEGKNVQLVYDTAVKLQQKLLKL